MIGTGRRGRLLVVVTDAMTADLLMRGQLEFLREAGWQVEVIASPGARLQAVADREGVEVVPVPMVREIAPFRDALSWLVMLRAIRRFRPDIVSAGTPKAGLLAVSAAWILRRPVRIYLLRGLRLESTTGIKRGLLALAERVTAKCATHVVCVSHSLRERALLLRLLGDAQATVLGHGSSNGVDTARYVPPRVVSRCAEEGGVVGFVGRLTADKGIADLVRAFDEVRKERPSTRLKLIGDLEPGDPLAPELRGRIKRDPAIEWTGPVDDTAPVYSLFDVVALPTAREGLPNVLLEAAASGIPVVAYRATGTVDVVDDGETGTLVPQGDISGLAAALLRYLGDDSLRRRHGAAARVRAERFFSADKVWRTWDDFYRRALGRVR